jgi:hypothetical protein
MTKKMIYMFSAWKTRYKNYIKSKPEGDNWNHNLQKVGLWINFRFYIEYLLIIDIVKGKWIILKDFLTKLQNK